MKRIFSLACIGLMLLFSHLTTFAQGRLNVRMEPTARGLLTPDRILNDFNDDPTALVEIGSELDNLQFSNHVFKVDKKTLDDGKEFIYSVYVLGGNNKIVVSHDDYIYTEIPLTPALKGGEVLSGVMVFGEMFDKLIVDYDDYADLYIDTQLHTNRDSIFLEEGTHTIKVKHGKYSDSKDVNIRNNVNQAALWLSGNVVLKGVGGGHLENPFTPIGDAPTPELRWVKGSKVKHGHMLGKYRMKEYANTHVWVEKEITVDPRTHNVFRLDEMVGYFCFMYHGTNRQPIGLNFAYCKDFGAFISWSTDLRFSIDTPYGKVDFKDKEGKDDWRTTAMTFSAGPMFKVVRKLYAQIGGGAVRYLSTSENKLLTGDYKYKWGGSACGTLFYRARNVILGLGYTHQFLKKPYNTGWRNQVNFSIGWAMGHN